MALSALTVLEVRNGGSDTNGGGFVTGASGTNHSLQDAAQYAVTDGVTAGTTTITSATANFGTDVVGNIMYVQGGTGSVVAGWYQITARTNATTITVDRSTGLTAGTGVTLNIGGALASPGQAGAIAQVAGMTTFIKYHASAYVATSASTNIAAGCVSGLSGTAYCGYDTTRSLYNTDANRPTFQIGAAVSTATLFGSINAVYLVHSMILDGNSQTASRGTQQSGILFNCKAMNCTTAGFSQNSNAYAILCEATACTALPFSLSFCYYCIAHDNTLTSPTGAGAFGLGTSINMVGCISYSNNCDGFAASLGYFNCVAYGNALFGFNNANIRTTYSNCIAESNTGGGFRGNTGDMSLLSCASYDNTGGRTVSSSGAKVWADINPITGSGSFFTAAASDDFTLNNTAGAGASCRAVGFPSTFPTPASNLNYSDVGPLQHEDAGGGTTTVVGVIG